MSYDQYLKTGPYNFGFLNTRPDWVEHFPYQDGLLISYWDTSTRDNNTSEHPGEGLILPIDAHPRPIYNLDGPAVAAADPAVRRDVRAGEGRLVHAARQRPGRATSAARPAQPLFDDSRSYFDPAVPTGGVLVPDTNTRIRVLSESGTSVRIRVSPG